MQKQFKLLKLKTAGLSALSLLVATFAVPGLTINAFGQDKSVEEVVVTGSYIKQSPEDAALPVDVVNSEDLFKLGSPSIVELIKSLGVSSGVDGETNQFQSNNLEGTGNINLRGLGAGRTLVLLNGRRNVYSPRAIAEQQQLFVDIKNIPSIALQQVEILKDGAAATYGSDAISGVVNFITRSTFEGFEVTASHKSIRDSNGDNDISAIFGHDFGNTNLMISASYSERSELRVADRDWAIRPDGFNGNSRAYTGIPNPGTILPLATIGDPTTFGIPGFVKDPESANLAGSINNLRDFGTYNFTVFDNLIEDENSTNLFSEITHEFNNDVKMAVELLWSQAEVPEWKSSPSYPPQTLYDTSYATGRVVPSYHPGLIDMATKYPDAYAAYTGTDYIDSTCSVTDRTDTSCDAFLFFGRPFGIVGPSQTGWREHDTKRIGVDFEGTFDNDISYFVSMVHSASEAEGVTRDTYSERWSLGMRGFGGYACDAAQTTPGENGCEFYNPFSNSIPTSTQKYADTTTNANYSADQANSAELRAWMTGDVGSKAETELSVYDAVFTGEADLFDWAIGAQRREETYKLSPNEINNLDINPCSTVAENSRFQTTGAKFDSANKMCDNNTTGDTSDDYTGSGAFIFLAGATPFDEEQSINAVFGEIRTDVNDRLELQLSARYEDYGGSVGDSFDPKIGIRYEANDDIVLRASASTTFRGPTLNQLGGQYTALSFINQTGTFKAVDTNGSADLKPETADTFNFGAIYNKDGVFDEQDSLFVSLDYWSIGFSDPLIRESFADLIVAAFGSAEKTAEIDLTSPYADRFSLAGTTASSIQRISVQMINGPDIDTDGLDFSARYSHNVDEYDVEWALQWNRILSYDVASGGLVTGFDAMNKLNDTVDYLRPIVEDKAKFGVTVTRGAHRFGARINHVGEYDDAGATRTIEAHQTWDLNYDLSLENFGAPESSAWIAIYNATDEDPPYAKLDLNYDPYTHNAFGRMIKVGVRHKF